MLGFLFGAIAGALAATYWHSDIKKVRDSRMPDLRQRAADTVEGAERRIVDTVTKLSTRATSTLRSGHAASRDRDTRASRGEETHLS
jgi:hypothetical protein